MATQLHIPNPCSEKWAQMHALDTGCRYCAVCEKTIVDFTLKSDAEILQHLQRNDGKVCGKFRPDQLQRPLLAYVPNSGNVRKTGFTAIAASFAAVLSAQHPIEPQPVTSPGTSLSPKTDERHEILGRIQPYTYLDQDSVRLLSGKITDESDQPLPGVQIWFSQGQHHTQSDLDGLFELKIPLEELAHTPLEIYLRYTGYPVKTVPVPDKVLTQDMALLPETTRFEPMENYMLGEIRVEEPHKLNHRVHAFFQKLFR